MSFWRNYYHLVWATHNREPIILPAIEPELYAFLVSKGAEIDVFTHAIGGCADHVHMVVSIPPKHAVSYVVKMLKGSSSNFANHVLASEKFQFSWQRGYGCLTVGEKQLPKAVAYTQNQKQHHDEQTSNRWLELLSEDDEGPSFGERTVKASHEIRESGLDYVIDLGEFPF